MKNVKLPVLILLFPFFFHSPLKAAEWMSPFNLDGTNKTDLAGPYQSPTTPLSPLATEIIEDRNRLGPVVITVSGADFGELGWGPLELKHFIKLLNILFPKKSLNSNDEALAAAFAQFNKDYFFLTDDGSPLSEPPAAGGRLDNYLEDKLAELPGYAEGNITVIPFNWSRDPEDTGITVPDFEKKLVEVYNTYKGTGRPIYIFAHSWGTVLMHETLHRTAVSHPEVKIDKFISMGSPLMPSNLVVALFAKLEIFKEDFQKAVSKPANLRLWRNFWASRDLASNKITAADANAQIDASVEKLEPVLINLILHDNLLRKAAAKDLLKLRNTGDWHNAYFFDYKASLESLHKEIYLPIFMPMVAPQVIYQEKN